MKGSFEYRLISLVNENSAIKKNTANICIYCPYILGILYIITLFYSFFKKRTAFIEIILIPVVTLIIVSVLRGMINKKRPFEELCIKPTVYHSKGKSFPSRHGAISISLSMGIFRINTYLGITAMALAVIICISRILCGIHYISDVLTGFVLGFGIWAVYLIYFN